MSNQPQSSSNGRFVKQYQGLLEISEAIIQHRDLDTLFHDLAERLKAVVDFDFISVSLHDPARKMMRLRLLETPQQLAIRLPPELPVEETPAGLVWKTRQPLLMSDVERETRFPVVCAALRAHSIKSYFILPLISAGQCLGTIGFGSTHENAFADTDLEFLRQVAKQVAVAIDNAINFQNAQTAQQTLAHERDRLRLLLEVNNAVTSHLDLHELLRAISTCLRRMIPHDFAGLGIYDEENEQLRVHALEFSGEDSAIKEGMVIPVSGIPAGVAFATRQPVLRHKIDFSEFHSPIYRQVCERMGLKSGCSVPLIVHDRIVGVINLASCREAAFTEEDAELLAQIGSQLAIALGNAINFRQAAHERDHRQLLLEVSNAVVSHLSLRDLLMSISACLRQFFNHDFASVVLYDEEAGQLRVHALDAPAPGGVLGEGALLPMEGTPPGLAIKTRQPVLRDRIDLEEFYSPIMRQAYDAGLRCGCSVPLISHDRVLGTINVGSLREAAFTNDDARLLTQIADQVAIAVENGLNFQRAARERDRSQLLLEVNNAATSHLDLRELLRATSMSLQTVIPHDAAGLALYEADSKQLRVHVLDALPEMRHVEEGFLIPLDSTPAGRAFATQQPVLIHHLDATEFDSLIIKRAIAAGHKSSCNVPLVFQDRCLGAAFIGSKTESAFTEADAQLFSHIAGQLAIAVANALSYQEIDKLKQKLTSEKLYLEEEIQTEYNFAEIVGQSTALREVLRQVETVAPTDSCVLLCGETGTGKELIARAIHSLSTRRERTLVKLNCAAIPTGLLESELFGHEKGAFTGAIAQRIGRFELAHKGTLLLDEVGEIPLELQPKLLRVLQEHEFERLGSSRTIKTDARLIAATNCDLPQMVAEKKFRSDLFYRLNVFPITIPPLRERADDIPLLAGYFAQKHALRMNKRIETVSNETVGALCRYTWPGNVRELENFIERAVILTRGSELQAPLAELKLSAAAISEPAAIAETHAPSIPKPVSLEDVERAHIEEILRQTRGVIGGRGGAAEILGLPISTLRGRMKKLGLK